MIEKNKDTFDPKTTRGLVSLMVASCVVLRHQLFSETRGQSTIDETFVTAFHLDACRQVRILADKKVICSGNLSAEQPPSASVIDLIIPLINDSCREGTTE